jgi:hypothetical protein
MLNVIFRALARAGKAYLKKEDDYNALRYLNKSLSEHRTTETQKLGGINFPMKYVPGTNFSFKKFRQNKFSVKYAKYMSNFSTMINFHFLIFYRSHK